MTAVALVYYGAVLIIVCGCFACAERYVSWRDFDRYRRLSRRAHRNLERGLR